LIGAPRAGLKFSEEVILMIKLYGYGPAWELPDCSPSRQEVAANGGNSDGTQAVMVRFYKDCSGR
jgi:hypothetical protein